MITIELSKPFRKQVEGLKPAQKKRIKKALFMFRTDPFNRQLNNHALSGDWLGHRSISFGGDWRAHYKELSDGSALFVAAGKHSQLYKG